MLPSEPASDEATTSTSSNSTSSQSTDLTEPFPKKAAMLHQSKAKKMKLFDFMAPAAVRTESVHRDQPDVSRDFQRLLNLPPSAGLAAFNDCQLASLKPVALKLFSAPSSSAASERVFSQAGLIMRATRSRLSRSRLAQLVFLKCNKHLK
jgi:hypothetical protein